MGHKMVRDFKATPPKLYSKNQGRELTYYYFLFEEDFKKLNPLLSDFDDEGIPLNSTYIDVQEKRPHYYPISIGQFALALFHSYLKTQSDKKQAHFLRIADWFVRTAKEDPKIGLYWLTDIPKPEFNVCAPWKSAFTQSRALSVLLRAWQLTHNDTYLKSAEKALRPFAIDIAEGGVSVDRNIQRTFYEEYVAQKPTRVLDGHGFSLFGLYDAVRALPSGDSQRFAQQLFDDGIEGLIRQLPDFDLGYWLRFNRCDLPHYPPVDPCTINYFLLVKAQLTVLYQLSEREELKQFQEKIARYNTFYNKLRAYKAKFYALKKINRL